MPTRNFAVAVTEPVSNSPTATFNGFTLTFSGQLGQPGPFDASFAASSARRRILGTLEAGIVNGQPVQIISFTTQNDTRGPWGVWGWPGGPSGGNWGWPLPPGVGPGWSPDPWNRWSDWPWPGVPPGQITLNSSATLPPGSYGSVNINNITAAPITITIAPGSWIGQTLRFKDAAGNATTFPITLSAQPSVDGMTSYQLVSNFASIDLVWMASQWGSR